MARTPARRATDGATFFARTERGRASLAALVPLLLVAALLGSRVHDVTQRPTAVSLAGGVAE